MFESVVHFQNEVYANSPNELVSFVEHELSEPESFAVFIDKDTYKLVFALRLLELDFDTIDYWVKSSVDAVKSVCNYLNTDGLAIVFVARGLFDYTESISYDFDELADTNVNGIPIYDKVIVDGSRWRSLLCDNIACCPEEGSDVVPWNDKSGEADNDNGLVDLLALNFAKKDKQIDVAQPSVASPADRLALLEKWAESDFVDMDTNEFVSNLQDIKLRDGFLRLTIDLDVNKVDRIIGYMIDCSKTVSGSVSVPLLTCIAGLSMFNYETAMAKAAIKAAKEVQSPYSYSLMMMIDRVLTLGVPLETWKTAVSTTSLEECVN